MNGLGQHHTLPVPNDSRPYKRQESMTAASRSDTPSNASESSRGAAISIGAIDNSLSWPWKHPDAVGTELSYVKLIC